LIGLLSAIRYGIMCSVTFAVLLTLGKLLLEWDTRTVMRIGCLLFIVLALVVWGLALWAKRSNRLPWGRAFGEAAANFGILAITFGMISVFEWVSPFPEPVPPWDPDEPKANQAGWVQLFNGKDLTGWKTHAAQPGNWRVDGNHLVSSRDPGYLFSEKSDWKDFHLRAELHIVQGSNSGIFFRTPYELKPAGKSGEYQLFAPTGWYEADIFWGTVAKPGRIKDLAEVTEELAQPNQWMIVEIIAQGNRLITRVNGKVAVDVVDSKSAFTSGHIALQAFTAATNVRFKKIEIKELPSEEPGWVQLFNGKDTSAFDMEKSPLCTWMDPVLPPSTSL